MRFSAKIDSELTRSNCNNFFLATARLDSDGIFHLSPPSITSSNVFCAQTLGQYFDADFGQEDAQSSTTIKFAITKNNTTTTITPTTIKIHFLFVLRLSMWLL